MLTEVIPKAQVLPISPALLAIHGYTMFTNFDPAEARLGASGYRGIAMFVSDKLNASTVKFNCVFHEQLWISIRLNGSDSLLMGCVYRSPSGNNVTSTALLADLLREVCSKEPTHLLVAGDFNIPHIDWEINFSAAHEHHHSHILLQAIADCFLFQHVRSPTRFRHGESPNILDLILSNDESLIQKLSYHPGLGSSDHVILRFQISCAAKVTPTLTKKRNFGRADFDALNQRILREDWNEMIALDVNESYKFFMDTLKKHTDHCVPLHRVKPRKKNLYMTSQALNLKKRKKMLWSKYIQSKDVIDLARFKRCRNQLRGLTRRLRKEFEKDVAKRIKKDPKQFWNYSRSRMKTRSGVGELLDERGRKAEDDKAKAQLLNDFFSSVFTRENMISIPEPARIFEGTELVSITITDDMVKGRLERLKPTSSPGPDDIHPRILKETAASLSGPLADIFRKSLLEGQLPKDWKTASVIPIYKKGDKHKPGNYRPVSLTSVPSKVLESLIRDQIMDHLTSTGQLSPHQHGFRARRSCVTQLLEVMEDWTKAIEDGDPVDALYLDFRKAFDSVPHERLLKKVSACGISGEVLNWIRAFLTERQQRVVVNGSSSPWSPVTSGVPQGSVLGPTLFILYINDMPGTVTSTVKIFADDTKIYRPVRTQEDRQQLQTELDAVSDWSLKWQMPFNADKCTVLHVGSRNPKSSYVLDGLQLKETDTERDLGILVDTELKFRKQAASAVAKASQILALIRRSFLAIDCETLPLLFKTLVRPHLEYGCSIWGPFFKEDQKAVERVQRRATRLVPELKRLPYPERLRILDLHSLYYRRRRGDMIRTYQIIHADLDLQPDDFFSPATYASTRGHAWKLRKEQARLRVRRDCFSVRVLNDWNALPPDVVQAKSLNQFKSRLDAHWAGIRFHIPD